MLVFPPISELTTMEETEPYDPFKALLHECMTIVTEEAAVRCGELAPTVQDAIIAKLYDDIDGGCGLWLAEQLGIASDVVNVALVAMYHEGRIFIYFEKKEHSVSARWRLTSDEWAREAARREAQSRSDS